MSQERRELQAEVLSRRLADVRSRKVVFLSHCLLNENTLFDELRGRASGVELDLAGERRWRDRND